ncbi:MAG: PTS system mannose/fructose/sorbose family transporter subunit IID [Bacillota bacterium]|jgi:mannose/fructose/N-acetylgalactosamine-specific phosphotransferase system component IID|nr:PTS system mannose/fructose/sorbose family transporter subunit IID [Bacillota bacterium]NLP22464.1 PTS system mannose/fructose/sorbose family transporter subunit IID [Erysipelotrichaceae bacterium]
MSSRVEKKVSKKALNASFWRWWYGNLTCFTHEHMQTFGYMWSLFQVIDDLYETTEEKGEKLRAYWPFFNTEPQIGCIVVGITAGLEEARANGDPNVDDEMINGIRAGLMGPLAGIGDSLIVGTYIPVLLAVALGLSEGGSVIGALFYIVVWNATSIYFQYTIFMRGYELGGTAVDIIVGDQATALRGAVVLLGQIIVGAINGAWVNITTPLEFKNAQGEVFLNLQGQLNGIMPGLLSIGFVLLCWWLMAKKNMKPLTVMLLMILIAFVGVLIGFFDPQLHY